MVLFDGVPPTLGKPPAPLHMGASDAMLRERSGAPTAKRTADWRDVLWREWKHTPDDALAGLIYVALAGDKPTGRAVRRVAWWRAEGWIAGAAIVGPWILGAAGAWVDASVSPSPDLFPWSWLAGLVACPIGAWLGVAGHQARLLRRIDTWHGLFAASALYLRRLAAQSLKSHGRGEVILYSGPPGALTVHSAPVRRRVPWFGRRPSTEEVLAALRHPDAPEWLRKVADPEAERRPARGLLNEALDDEPVLAARARLLLAQGGGRAVHAVSEATRNGLMPREVGGDLASRTAEPTASLAPDAAGLLCPDCFCRVGVLRAGRLRRLAGLRYYGCRCCRRSHDLLRHDGPVLAVLDSEDGRESWGDGDTLYVNWLARPRDREGGGAALFDFESVEIRCATEEDIERFLVRVANDTDAVRRKRYDGMRVQLMPGCEPGERAIRMLRDCFPAADLHAEAAVHGEHRAGDVRGGVACEEPDRLSHLVGPPEA